MIQRWFKLTSMETKQIYSIQAWDEHENIQKYDAEAGKTAQQYLLPLSGDMEKYGVRLGAFVCNDDSDDVVRGFISDFDESYVEFTLFEPKMAEDLPKDTIVLKEKRLKKS